MGKFNAICVVIDLLIKQQYYILCSDTIDAWEIENLYYTYTFYLYGLPNYVISDRVTQFIMDFWARLTQRLGITLRLSTVYYPKTNRQTKNVNKIMEQYLHSFISYQEDDWLYCFPVQNFPQIIILHHPLILLPFLLTSVIILLLILSHLK